MSKKKGDPCPRCKWPLFWITADNDTASLGCANCGWPGPDNRVEDSPEPEPTVPLPPELWEQAAGDHDRYVELMVEHGHLTLHDA